MEVIKQVAPINESVTVLLMCGPEDDGTSYGFDPLFNGWHLNYAVYDDIEVKKDDSLYGCAGLLAYCPGDFAQIEKDYLVVPTMYCKDCRNRMEAYTDICHGKAVLSIRNVKYRCRICGYNARLREEKT